MWIAQEAWQSAARAASNLSRLELTLGETGAAIRDGEGAIAHADQSGDAFDRMDKWTIHAEAWHQACHRAEAKAPTRDEHWTRAAPEQEHMPSLAKRGAFEVMRITLLLSAL